MNIAARMAEYITYKGLTAKRLEEVCKLGNGTLSKLSEKTRESTIDRIINQCIDLNREWLLTGKGDMLANENKSSGITTTIDASVIPMLPTSAQAGSLNEFVTSVRMHDCEKVVSPAKGAEFALPVTGDSMSPEYPNGSQIHVKRINEQAFIEWGKVYVLDTCNGTVIKRVVPSEREGYVRCVSINPDPIYAPFEVAFADIYGMYRVLLCLSIK